MAVKSMNHILASVSKIDYNLGFLVAQLEVPIIIAHWSPILIISKASGHDD